MNDLVTLKKDECYTTSKVVADNLNRKHKSIRQLIETNENDFLEFGRLPFQMTPLKTKSGIQNFKVYFLNEQQATYLITLMRNTEKVRQFKIALVKEFYKMRNFILEKQSTAWIETRKQGKLTRKSETDTIKELVEYAKGQGSKNANMLYMTYSKLANKMAGISNRDTATITELNNLSLIEHITINVIRQGMEQNKHYKEIYQDCKKALETFNTVAYLRIA